MFTQSCFIRKNTPELRKKLEDLGYYKSDFGSDFNNSIATTVFNEYKSLYTCIREQSFDDTNPHTTWGLKFRIDCGTNEELFLALAALSDDDDYMQWFTDGEKWYQNRQNDIEVIRYGAGSPINFHKATVEEIIEHFKTK
jgi:hypothetical protein